MSAVPLQIQFDPASARFGASRSQKRLEDERLLLGKGLFSDDRVFPRQAWMVLVRSPHAHARISSIDFSECKRLEGVIAAWSMADLRADGVKHIPFPPLFKRADGSPMAAPPRTPLAEGKVFYVGQPVAAIVARDARAGAGRGRAGSDRIRRSSGRGRSEKGHRARRAAALGAGERQCRRGGALRQSTASSRKRSPAAAHVTEIELHNQRLNAMAMEPRCAIGVHEGGRTTLYTQNQQPTGARDLLGAVFGAKPQDFRVINGDIGGGFGMKTGLTPEDALVCYAARKLGRPVKWRAERGEEFLAAHMARDQHYRAALALDREGRILALRMEMLANIGAVPVGSSAMIPLAMVAKVATSAYRVPAVDYRIKGVLTNTMATGAYRGAGRPEGNYLIERLIEKAAREMRHRPRRAAPAQPAQARRASVQDARRRDLRQRRVRAHAGRERSQAADWNGFRREQPANRQSGESCAAGASRSTWNGPARYPRRRWTSRSTPTAR